MDPSFGVDGIALIPGVYVHALEVDSQQRVVIAGEKSIDTIAHSYVARFDASGQPDASFGSAGDGGVVIGWDGVAGQGGYLTSLSLIADDGILVGGSYEVYGAGMGSDFAVARLDAEGAFDTTFAGSGWRVFHRPDEAPGIVIDGIDRMLPTADGGAVFAGHYSLDDGQGNTVINVVLGRLLGDGTADPAFGAAASPGFQPIDLVPGAWTRYPTGLAEQSDGKLVASVSYSIPGKSNFLAFRTSSNGVLDADFGEAGVQSTDLAPTGIFSDASVLLLDANGRAVLAGIAERTSPLYELALLRLTRDRADRIFANGFDGTR
jgi:uncharacterized delta-60 repeat protein